MLVHTFRGIGYLSSSRELVKISYGRNDPNGYYLILDLDPQCSMSDLKKRYRELVKKYHPDGKEPNSEKFREIKEIFNVLNNSITRKEYNSIPDNSSKYFIGVLEKEKLRRAAWERKIPLDKLVEDQTLPDNQTNLKDQDVFYTYMADSAERQQTAQQWYGYLHQAAWSHCYTGTLRVAVCPLDSLHDVTNTGNYLIFWFHTDVDPNWAIAY
jgi:curved DNA-binding protein CbpA